MCIRDRPAPARSGAEDAKAAEEAPAPARTGDDDARLEDDDAEDDAPRMILWEDLAGVLRGPEKTTAE